MRNSKTSSQVTMRSPEGMLPAKQLNNVVLPAPTAPATTMLSPAATEASRKREASALIDPSVTSSERRCALSPVNLRMFTDQ